MKTPKEHTLCSDFALCAISDMETCQNIRLTRYLYIYDEVVYSLITSLLMRKDIHVCYYLVSELYATDAESVFELLWKIYFDFYAENHPTLETCLANKHRAWRTAPEIRPVIFIIKNMFQMQGSPTVFHLRQFVENNGKCLCLYRLHEKMLIKRGWKDHPKLVCRLFIAIERGHIQNAGCYIFKLLESFSSDIIYFMLVDYFSGYVSLKKIDNIRSRWKKRIWSDDGHMLLAFIVSMLEPVKNIVRRIAFKPPSDTEMKFIKEISCVDGMLRYRILREKRNNVLVPEIASFQLARHSMVCDDMIDKVRDNWEYYAIRTPLWKKRFARFGGRVEERKVVFPSEDNEERFYEEFGLELDEQSLDVQNMGFTHGMKCGWHGWYKKVFEGSPRIILNTDYSYIW